MGAIAEGDGGVAVGWDITELRAFVVDLMTNFLIHYQRVSPRWA